MPAVQAEKVGNRIHVRSPFKYKDRVKGIIGARWSPKDKVWTLPLDMETCRRLRDEFGDDLQVMHALWRWATEAVVIEKQAGSLVDVREIDLTEVVDLPVVSKRAPTMWAAMQNRPYQPIATKYMAITRRCLNGDQPGVGKTIETLGALVELEVTGPIIVLAPKTSALTVWPAEIKRWLADDVPYTITQTAGLTPAKRDAAYAEFRNLNAEFPGWMHFLIANAEQVRIKVEGECPAGICNGDEDWCPSLDRHRSKRTVARPFLHSINWQAIVADETHKWLINTRGKSASQVGYGFTRLRTATEESPMYALSGTPLKGKKHNLFGTLNWIWPKVYTSRWRFIESYWIVQKETVDAGRKGMIETRNITGEWRDDKAEAAFRRAMKTVMIRRTKDELRRINPAWMPPEKRYHDVWVPMEGSQASHYKAMEKAAAVTLGNERLTATGVLAEMTRLKQFANSDGEMRNGVFTPTLPSAKFNWLLQFLEERGIEQADPRAKPGTRGDLSDDVQKVVVASQFTTLIDLWAAELDAKGIECATVTGKIKDREREAVVQRFQQDPTLRVVLINTMAGGVSITLDAADDIVIMDETWVPDDQEQVEDRVHRASNVEHQVDVWYVRTEGTIEEGIAATNMGKAESNHVVLDASRGLMFARERFGLSGADWGESA